MSSFLSVVTAASDRTLLTIAELREAVGVSDDSKDAQLEQLNARLSATIANACHVAPAGAVPPTLRRETLSETIRSYCSRDKLVLSRFPVALIASVTENGCAIDPDYDVELEPASGIVYRLSGDCRVCWPRGKVVFQYDAGWEVVPEDLRLAAAKLASVLWSEGAKSDPGLRKEEIPGVITREWWVGPSSDPVIPKEVMDLLQPYRNHWIG